MFVSSCIVSPKGVFAFRQKFIAYPLLISGNVAETHEATLQGILINFNSDLEKFLWKYSPWNNFRV